MAIKVTTWKPDTCGCVLQYSWDDETSEEEREHTFHSIQKCKHHDHHGHEEAYQRVHHENQTKNIAVGHLHERHPEKLMAHDTDGNHVYRDGAVLWTFDKKRRLLLDAPILSHAEKADHQRHIEAQKHPIEVILV